MSELQEVNIEEELSKSENEDVPVLSIQTDPLEEPQEEQQEEPQEEPQEEHQEEPQEEGQEEGQEEPQQEEPHQEEPQQEELLSSLIQGSPSQSPSKEEVDDIQESLEEGEIPEDLSPTVQISEDIVDTVDTTVNLQNEQSMLQNEQDSDEDSSDEEENIIYKNLEEDIDTNILKFYHPETENINYKELLTLSKITKNKKGEIIDPFHKTLPFITQYEKAKILGQRAKQINHGSTPFVDISSNIIDGHTIALMEFNQKKIPFIIRRPLPNGTSEYWKVKDLKIIM